ncbi:unnamed protein product [Jaminaea pallidilutea]
MEGGSTDKILAGVASEAALGCEEGSDQCGDDRVHAKDTRLTDRGTSTKDENSRNEVKLDQDSDFSSRTFDGGNDWD